MAFGFNPAVPLDQVAYNGVPAPQVPAVTDAAPPPAQTPQAAPQGLPPGLPDIQVSPAEAFISMLMGGGTPGEAAQRVRATKLKNIQDAYALRQQQILMGALQGAPPTRQLAMLLNPGEEGKALASGDQSMLMNGGQTRNGPQGSYIAPLVGMDEKSGRGYTFVPQTGQTIAGGSLGGDINVSPTGAVVSGRTGLTGDRVAIPQIIAPGATLVPFTPGVSGPTGPSAAGQAPAQPAAPIPGANAKALLDPSGRLDPLAVFKNFTLPEEGGFNPHDGNGAPTNMGINQTANPDLDVRNITPQQAAQRFAQYYQRSGAAQMPPALGLVHSDTYFINPKMAQAFLRQSGGDPARYLALRQQWMDRLSANVPALAKYAQPWAHRNAALGTLVAQLSPQQAAADGTFIGPGVGGKQTEVIPPGDPTYNGVAPGTKLQRSPTGEITTFAKPNSGDQKLVGDYMETARQLENLASLGDRFNSMNRETATGPLYDEHEVEIPLLHAEVPLNPVAPAMRASHTDVRDMENLANQMALAQRTPGMRLTQMEFQKFLGSAPSINNPGPQNAKIIQGYHELAQDRRAYANFMSDWLAQHGSLQGADHAWQAHQQAVTKSSQKIKTYNPATGAIE